MSRNFRLHSPGDLVRTRLSLPDIWNDGDSAAVTEVFDDGRDAPVLIKINSGSFTGKLISTQAWRLQPDAGAVPSAVGAASGVGVPPGSPDFDDLPWQVIAIMSVEKMEELWEQKQRHDSMLGGLLGATPHADPEPSSTDTAAADEACADRRFDDGVRLYDEVLDSIGGWGGASTDAALATVRARKAGCLRRAYRPADALAELGHR